MTCQQCDSTRVAEVIAKCSDRFSVTINHPNSPNHVDDFQGYVPRDIGIGGGDNVKFSYCLDCGQVQGYFPLAYSQMESDAEGDELDDDTDNQDEE